MGYDNSPINLSVPQFFVKMKIKGIAIKTLSKYRIYAVELLKKLKHTVNSSE